MAENAMGSWSFPYKWSHGILRSTGRGPTFVGGGFSFNILFFKCSPRKLGKCSNLTNIFLGWVENHQLYRKEHQPSLTIISIVC